MNESVLAWCRRIIASRSVTNEGTRAIAEMCARDLLAPRGIHARLIASAREGDAQVNLIATIKGRDSAAVPLVLSTHLDTVPPGEAALWTECDGDPFIAALKRDRIYGLGAADTKLDFVAKVMALTDIDAPRRNVSLVGTFGEEHGLVGAKEIAESGILPRGGMAFVGEPSHLEVITAHKGLMVFELRLRFEPQPLRQQPLHQVEFAGRAAHSSTPALGRNAIRLALETLEAHPELHIVGIDGGDAVNKVPAQCTMIVAGGAPALIGDAAAVEPGPNRADFSIPGSAIAALARFVRDLQEFADRAGPAEPDYAPPTLTCNPGVIRSTGDSVLLQFELRPPPALALDTVRDGVAKISASLGANDAGLTIEVAERRANPSFRSAFEGETVEAAMAALARAGLPLASGVKSGCTEAGIYAAAGLRPVVFGPGPSTGVIHAPNEYNLIAEVEGAIRFYRELVRL